MKYCPYCNQQKPFDPKAEPHRKASGFHGPTCWDCWLKYQSQRNKLEKTDPHPMRVTKCWDQFERDNVRYDKQALQRFLK